MKKYIISLFLLSMLGYGTALAQVGVDFEIRNAQVNGNNYEFDVYMAADQLGTYHTRGMVYVTYNDAAFGTKVATNNKVTYRHLNLLNETVGGAGSAKYSTVNIIDNFDNILALTWAPNPVPASMPLAMTRTEMPTAMTPLYHISIQMQDPTAAANISLGKSLMGGQQYFQGTGIEIPYKEGSINGLPVEIVNFSGKLINVHDVKLEWLAANETNFSHYVIEKKKGENGSFTYLAKVDAKNVGAQASYNYIDRSGMQNVVSYRLKLVDLDGTFKYSNVVLVQLEGLVDNDMFNLFPNPASASTSLMAKTAVQEDFTFTISDLLGQVVQEGKIEKGNKEVDVNISGLAAGTYYFKTTNPVNGEAYLNKLVKTN